MNPLVLEVHVARQSFQRVLTRIGSDSIELRISSQEKAFKHIWKTFYTNPPILTPEILGNDANDSSTTQTIFNLSRFERKNTTKVRKDSMVNGRRKKVERGMLCQRMEHENTKVLRS